MLLTFYQYIFKFGKFLSQIWDFFHQNWKKNAYFLALGTGPFMGPGYIGRQIPELALISNTGSACASAHYDQRFCCSLSG